MKRLLLVMGIVGCGGEDDAPTPNDSQAKVDEPPVQTVALSKLVERGGLIYEANSETPFTGVRVVSKHENGQKWSEATYKVGKLDGPFTAWHENGQKQEESTFKDGNREGLVIVRHENGKKWQEATLKDGKREGPLTAWYESGQKAAEVIFKDGKEEGPATYWHENGQKQEESTFKDGKVVSETKWDEEGNEIKE